MKEKLKALLEEKGYEVKAAENALWAKRGEEAYVVQFFPGGVAFQSAGPVSRDFAEALLSAGI